MKLIRTMMVCGIAALGMAGGVSRADDVAGRPVTFNKDIVPIFQSKCQECHRPDQLAPMSLVSFQEARPWAKSIKKAVVEREMPPWDADPQYGKFDNDISLSEEQIATIVKWVDSGAPEGDAADLPPAKVWADGEWKAGQPDLILTPPVAFSVPPMKPTEDIYQCIVLPTNFEEDVWIQGVEYHVDKRQVVHHVIGFIDEAGRTPAMDAATPEPGYRCGMWSGVGVSGMDALLGGWAPGMPPNVNEPGIGKIVQKGANVILQMHYHNETDKTFEDRSSVGVFFAKKPIHNKGRIMPVSQNFLKIKAGDPNAENKATWRVPRDIQLTSIMPHMHYIGKDMKISAIYGDGREEMLLSVPRYDFNWQTVYHLAERKLMPKGTMIRVIGHHDNSAENPRNPSKPPIDVTIGESTTEEMMIGWIGYVFADEDLNVNPVPPKIQVGSTAPKEEKLAANR